MEEAYVRTISWSTEDFESRATDLCQSTEEGTWDEVYDESKFADALDKIIDDHDANHGISWNTIDYYLDTYCKRN